MEPEKDSTPFDPNTPPLMNPGETFQYRCDGTRKHPSGDTTFDVTCDPNTLTFAYPNPVPQCLDTMQCDSEPVRAVSPMADEYDNTTTYDTGDTVK